MNRQDLSWALSATLPHAGKTAQTALVGLVVAPDSVLAYATDDYTAGIARIPHGVAEDFELQLPNREATDLMRFVRPNHVGDREQEVILRIFEGELHVAIPEDTAVFTLTEQPVNLNAVLSFMGKLNNAPKEWQHAIFQPSLLGRFAKAEREQGERLRLYPRHANQRYGAALVTVGDNFIGAVAGLEYDDAGDRPLLSFLQAERKAA